MWPSELEVLIGKQLELEWTGYPSHIDDGLWPREDEAAPQAPAAIKSQSGACRARTAGSERLAHPILFELGVVQADAETGSFGQGQSARGNVETGRCDRILDLERAHAFEPGDDIA